MSRGFLPEHEMLCPTLPPVGAISWCTGPSWTGLDPSMLLSAPTLNRNFFVFEIPCKKKKNNCWLQKYFIKSLILRKKKEKKIIFNFCFYKIGLKEEKKLKCFLQMFPWVQLILESLSTYLTLQTQCVYPRGKYNLGIMVSKVWQMFWKNIKIQGIFEKNT